MCFYINGGRSRWLAGAAAAAFAPQGAAGFLLPVQRKRVPAVVVRYGRHPFA
jgi:hypothetical protein